MTVGTALHVVAGIMILRKDAAVGQEHDMVHGVRATKASGGKSCFFWKAELFWNLNKITKIKTQLFLIEKHECTVQHLDLG